MVSFSNADNSSSSVAKTSIKQESKHMESFQEEPFQIQPKKINKHAQPSPFQQAGFKANPMQEQGFDSGVDLVAAAWQNSMGQGNTADLQASSMQASSMKQQSQTSSQQLSSSSSTTQKSMMTSSSSSTSSKSVSMQSSSMAQKVRSKPGPAVRKEWEVSVFQYTDIL